MSMEFQIKQVNFCYDKEMILKGVAGGFREAGLYGIFGPNGSGKTTLLKCCAGILSPQKGSIEFAGNSLHRMNYRERGHLISYVPQEHSLSFPFTVEEVVLMGRTPHLGGLNRPHRRDEEVAHAAMEEIGIAELSEKPYTQLSGGQRQLVLLARAIAQDTPVIILDEPTSALDFRNQLLVYEILRKLARKGKMIIACTHDPNHVKWFCDEVLILKNGMVLCQGAVNETLTERCLQELYGGVCALRDGMIVPQLENRSL
mgnify:CR=1 FL=1